MKNLNLQIHFKGQEVCGGKVMDVFPALERFTDKYKVRKLVSLTKKDKDFPNHLSDYVIRINTHSVESLNEIIGDLKNELIKNGTPNIQL